VCCCQFLLCFSLIMVLLLAANILMFYIPNQASRETDVHTLLKKCTLTMYHFFPVMFSGGCAGKHW
jgi:hypothetical protein